VAKIAPYVLAKKPDVTRVYALRVLQAFLGFEQFMAKRDESGAAALDSAHTKRSGRHSTCSSRLGRGKML